MLPDLLYFFVLVLLVFTNRDAKLHGFSCQLFFTERAVVAFAACGSDHARLLFDAYTFHTSSSFMQADNLYGLYRSGLEDQEVPF